MSVKLTREECQALFLHIDHEKLSGDGLRAYRKILRAGAGGHPDCIGPGGQCPRPEEWRRSEPYGWYGMVPCPVHTPRPPFFDEMDQMIRDAGKEYLLSSEAFLEKYPHLRCDPPDTAEDW